MNAMPVRGGRAVSSRRKASRPPAEAPRPTTGKLSCPSGERRLGDERRAGGELAAPGLCRPFSIICQFYHNARHSRTAVRYIFAVHSARHWSHWAGIVGERSGHERGVNAMRHYNSVFHQLLKHLPWEEFDALVKEHRADARVRRLTTISKSISKRTCGRW